MIPKVESVYNNTFIVNINNIEWFYYSYNTCVGYKNVKYNIEIRINKFFSKTTSKHLSKMEIGHFTPIDEEEFELIIKKCQSNIY